MNLSLFVLLFFVSLALPTFKRCRFGVCLLVMSYRNHSIFFCLGDFLRFIPFIKFLSRFDVNQMHLNPPPLPPILCFTMKTVSITTMFVNQNIFFSIFSFVLNWKSTSANDNGTICEVPKLCEQMRIFQKVVVYVYPIQVCVCFSSWPKFNVKIDSNFMLASLHQTKLTKRRKKRKTRETIQLWISTNKLIFCHLTCLEISQKETNKNKFETENRQLKWNHSNQNPTKF